MACLYTLQLYKNNFSSFKGAYSNGGQSLSFNSYEDDYYDSASNYEQEKAFRVYKSMGKMECNMGQQPGFNKRLMENFNSDT